MKDEEFEVKVPEGEDEENEEKTMNPMIVPGEEREEKKKSNITLWKVTDMSHVSFLSKRTLHYRGAGRFLGIGTFLSWNC